MIIIKSIQLFFTITSRINKKWAALLAIELLFRPRRTKRSRSEELFWQSGEQIIFKSGCIGRRFDAAKANDKVICVIHGWQSQGSRFRTLISHFTDQGYQVITWNGPGHGQSPGHRTNLPAFSRMLFADLKALNISFYALIGHSFGAAASAYVCKLGLDVKKLVLISGPTSTFGVFERYWDFIKLGKSSRPLFIELVEKEVGITIDDMSLENYAHQLKQEVMVVHDKNDKIIPISDIENLKRTQAQVHYFETEKLGHHRIISDVSVRNSIEQFINKSSKLAIVNP